MNLFNNKFYSKSNSSFQIINIDNKTQYLPNDFNWEMYISLNSDLNHIKDKTSAITHYLNHGIAENRNYKKMETIKKYQKYMNINKGSIQDKYDKLPNYFDWKTYIYLPKHTLKTSSTNRHF